MKFFRDILAARSIIEDAIQVHGYAAEHNFYWYWYCADKNERNVFVYFPGEGGLLTIEGKNVFYVFSMPLAAPSRRIAILRAYLTYVLARTPITRVEIELESDLRQELLRTLPPHLKARAIIKTLTAPVMDFTTFDGCLSGKYLKSLRHAKNKFYRLHSVEIRDARACGKEELHGIIDRWRKKRPAHDTTLHERYYNMITHNFDGMKTARVFIVDGNPCGINAGWEIPNSNRFSAAIGIHDYSYSDLGVVLYLEDLEWLRAHGYSHADMGGSDKTLLNFKRQFLPAQYYKTHFFSIARNTSPTVVAPIPLVGQVAG